MAVGQRSRTKKKKNFLFISSSSSFFSRVWCEKKKKKKQHGRRHELLRTVQPQFLHNAPAKSVNGGLREPSPERKNHRVKMIGSPKREKRDKNGIISRTKRGVDHHHHLLYASFNMPSIRAEQIFVYVILKQLFFKKKNQKMNSFSFFFFLTL